MTRDGHARAAGLVVIAATLWGCWSLFLRPTGLSGAVTAPLLMLGVSLAAAPLAYAEIAKRPIAWSRSLVVALLLYALFDALNVGTFFPAMVITTVPVAVLTHSVAPVLVAVLSPVVEGTRSRRAAPASLGALLGLSLVLEPWRGASLEPSLVLGAGLGLASAVGYAGAVFAARRLGRGMGPATVLSSHAVLAGLLLLPLAGSELASIEPVDLVWMLLAVLLPGLLAGLLFVRALTVIGSARAAVLALLEPLVACVVGAVAWGEALGPLGLVGGGLVLGAALWVATEAPEDVPLAASAARSPLAGERQT